MFNLNHSAHLGNAELAQQAAEKSIRCVARTGDIVLGVIAVGNSKQQAFRPKGRMLCREQRQSKSLILDEVFFGRQRVQAQKPMRNSRFETSPMRWRESLSELPNSKNGFADC